MTLKSELEALWAQYVHAYRTGDAAGCAAVFTEDARMTSPFGPEAVGRDAIEAQHADWVAEGSDGKQIDIIDCDGSGDVAWCFVRFSEGSDTGDGVSLSVLQRGPMGWKIRLCSLNESVPSST